jgi:acyl carrier protein
MSDAALSAQVVELVREVGKLAPTVLVGPESRFVEDLGIDSLDLVAVFLAVQDRLGVEILDEDITALKTVSDLVAYVTPRYATRAA